jgi:uncharacterized caspase-like protein/tetratricopeptide (TPR) repeat protein
MARASPKGCRAIFTEKYMLHKTILNHRLLLTALCAVFSLTPLCQAQSNGDSPKTLAVVIGISKYPKLPDNQQLLYADRDAQAFAAAIRKISGDNVRLLVNQEATVEAIKDAVGNWLAQAAAENDTVTIYFSGHGIAETAYGEAYLLAYDSDAKSPYASGVSLRELSYAITRRVKANRILIIADAVRREFFDAEMVGETPSKIFSTSFNQLSQWRSGIATVLASSPGEYSREAQKWDSHGVFTKHLVDAINSGIDLNADKTSDGEEIFSSVWARVSKDTSKKQYPSKSGPTLSQIKLASKVAVAVNSASLPAESQASTANVNSVQNQSAASVQKAAEPTIVAKSNQQAPAPANPAAISPSRPEAVQPTTTPAVTQTTKATSPAINRGEPVKTNQPPVNKTEIAKTNQPTVAATTQPAQPPATNNQPKVTNPANPTVGETTTASAAVKPKPAPPATTNVPLNGTAPATERVTTPIPATISTPAPSPMVLELESAIAVGRLVEPKGNCAWDTYQQLTQEPALAAEAARLKARLAEALFTNGKAVISNDMRSDNIADKVDDFKRAGLMLSKARLLTPEKTEIIALEKLCAAAALLSLQFFDEAEKALTQLPKTAATENALGIVYAGKLDNWKAERAFKNALEMDSLAAAPHYNLGLLFRSQKNEGALAEFEKAAELDAKNYATFLAIGDEYFSQNKWQPSAEAYRRAVALRPYDDNLYTKLGHALYSQGLRDEANKAYQKAKEIRSKQ